MYDKPTATTEAKIDQYVDGLGKLGEQVAKLAEKKGKEVCMFIDGLCKDPKKHGALIGPALVLLTSVLGAQEDQNNDHKSPSSVPDTEARENLRAEVDTTRYTPDDSMVTEEDENNTPTPPRRRGPRMPRVSHSQSRPERVNNTQIQIFEDQNVSDRLPPELLAEIEREIPKNMRGTPEAIDRAAKFCVAHNIIGIHCWQYVRIVYEIAGYNLGKTPQTFDSVNKYIKTGSHDCGKFHFMAIKYPELRAKAISRLSTKHDSMPSEGDIRSEICDMLAEGSRPILTEGSHITINNKNRYSATGNHSEIFLGWIDKKNFLAKVSGYSGKRKPPYIKERFLGPNDYNKPATPITRIRTGRV